MRKSIFACLLLAFLVIFNGCMMNKKEMTKVHKIAIVSLSCDKSLYQSNPNFLNLLVSGLMSDSIKLHAYAERLRNRANTEMFSSLRASVIPLDSVSNQKNYLSLKNFITGSYSGYNWDITCPKGSKMTDNYALNNYNILNEMYPDVNAYVFIRVHYQIQVMAGMGKSFVQVGLAKIIAVYDVSIHNRDGKRIFYEQMRGYSHDTFPYLITPCFNEDSRVPLQQADERAYKRVTEFLTKKFGSIYTASK